MSSHAVPRAGVALPSAPLPLTDSTRPSEHCHLLQGPVMTPPQAGRVPLPGHTPSTARSPCTLAGFSVNTLCLPGLSPQFPALGLAQSTNSHFSLSPLHAAPPSPHPKCSAAICGLNCSRTPRWEASYPPEPVFICEQSTSGRHEAPGPGTMWVQQSLWQLLAV